MEELVPKAALAGRGGRVLEQLLRERVSIRDLAAILEALIETAPLNKSGSRLVEASRQALGRRLVQPLARREGQLPSCCSMGRSKRRFWPRFRPKPGRGCWPPPPPRAGTPVVAPPGRIL